ncbi:MAG: acetyl-CoA carboxylase biotin carboxyl carrier protein [Planctomycetes bacterium]|nr:acetyl-CoA carboxylase biotin carboxyl carrier protein [Planctomycetota bacterium]
MELHEKIQQLAKILRDSDLGEILVEEEGIRIRLRKSAPAKGREYMALPAMAAAPMALPAAAPVAASAPAAAAPVAAAPAAEAGLVPFLSPMVGTFYRSPSPDREVFVKVGSRVNADSTLCIIEAMKVMNEIKAETSGEVAKVLVENGAPVEFGQPLFLIRPA